MTINGCIATWGCPQQQHSQSKFPSYVSSVSMPYRGLDLVNTTAAAVVTAIAIVTFSFSREMVWTKIANFFQLFLRDEWTTVDQVWKRHLLIIGPLRVCFVLQTNCCNSKRWQHKRAWVKNPATVLKFWGSVKFREGIDHMCDRIFQLQPKSQSVI